MSEATVQAALMAVLTGVVGEGSVLINDFETPQVSSIAMSPWLIIETGDDIEALNGEAWSDPQVIYHPYVTILSYRGGRTNTEHITAFQGARQQVIDAMRRADNVRSVTAVTPISPASEDAEDADPPSLVQRFVVEAVEYG